MRDIGKKSAFLKLTLTPTGVSELVQYRRHEHWSPFFFTVRIWHRGNLQNIEDLLRSIFVADPGMKMAYIDAEQGEKQSCRRIEYALFGDGRYLDACRAVTFIQTVAKLVWPRLPWTGDIDRDMDLAEQPYYRPLFKTVYV